MILPEPPERSLRLRLDRGALAANWQALDRLSGNADAGAAVKANAYGLGVDGVVPALRDAGARNFFLAHWSEVSAVLKHVEGSAISVLHGVRNAEEAGFAKASGVIPVINSLRQAAFWNEAGGGPCHVMVDTGINRLGLSIGELGDPVVQALEVDILMSHLACADEESALNARQLALLHEAVPQVRSNRVSMANSAGIMIGPDYHFDLTRPGIALYGGIPHPALSGSIAQVAYPQAAVIQLRNLSPGDSVGYNAMWTAERPTRAATISIGYADGFLRQLGLGSALQHEGQTLPVLGRVSMDMVVVDASASKLQEGDFVDIPFDLPSIAAHSGLSQYETLTLLGQRFARRQQG